MEANKIKKGKSKTTYFPHTFLQFLPYNNQIYLRKSYLKYKKGLFHLTLIFLYDFFMTVYSLSNFDLLESHMAQFDIGFKKFYF